MKKLILVLIAISIIAMSGVALAEDTNTVTVTANVVGTCMFNSATSTLAFGGLDPNSGADVTVTAEPTFWCTKNATYSVTDDDGLYESGPNANMMQHATTLTEFIPYSFSYLPTSGSGQGRTTPITLNISGTVTFANYQNAEVGNYSDTVVVTIKP